MALDTRWYLVAIARGSRLPTPQKPGFYPAVFEFADTAPGESIGWLPSPPLGNGLCAVTFDDQVADPVAVAATWAAFQAAPDARVFDLETCLETRASSWSKKTQFETELAARGLDPSRFASGGLTVRSYLRETARAMLLYRWLGHRFPMYELSATLGDLPAFMLASLNDHLLESGFPVGEIPATTTTLQATFRTLLGHSTWKPYDPGIDAGSYFLGHRGATL